jgi:hypothetical protein
MKTFKDILSEDVYLVKMSNKEGRTMVRQYRGKSEMEVSSKAKVDAKIRGYSVDSVRLMSKEKEVEEAYVASADYKVSPSGRKVHKMKKVSDEPEDDEDDEDDKKDIKEAVTVKKANYSWGKMVTVHHGSENSYPLHPNHQKKIASLKDGEKTSFTDETNRKVNAHREGDKVHLTSKDSNKKTTVAHSHFTESVDLEEAVDKQEQRFLMLARLGLVDKSDVSKLRIAMDQLKADKPLTVAQRSMLLNVMSDLVSLVTGDDAIFNRAKMDIQKESIEDLDENTEALKKKAEKSGISLGTLKTVYRRGVAAWNSGHRPGTTPQQWGMARVNSYITKGKGTYHGADKDLREGGEPGEFNVNDIDEACWDTHKQVGMKKKGDKMVPNCVPKESVELEEDSRLDNKAYHKGVSDKTAQARVSHWKKMDKLSDRDPRAYKPAPGDATAETKPSKHTQKYHAMYGEAVVIEEDSVVVDEGYVSLAQQRAVWATRKDGGKGHPDNKNKTKKEETDVPFDPDPPRKNPIAKAGKFGQGYSTARHLAKLALKKQQEKQAQKAQNK